MDYSIERILGFSLGVVIPIAFLWILLKLIKRHGGLVDFRCKKDSFDERQLLARGKAYKAGFFTLTFYLILVITMKECFDISALMSVEGLLFGIFLSLMVFAVICILKDAYMSLYENRKGIILMLIVAGILNLAAGLGAILHESWQNGFVNLMCVVMVVVILTVFCGKQLYDKRQEDRS